MAWLSGHHPRLVPKYDQLYRRSAYAPKAYQETIAGLVQELAAGFGMGRRGPREARSIRGTQAGRRPSGTPASRRDPSPGEQLTLV